MQSTNINYLIQLLMSSFINNTINQIQNLNAKLEDEFLLNVQEKQINEALANFVTRNVKAILDMKIELNDGWFRLSCIINIQGIYTKVASNFDLVHIQLDRQRQRLVFAQRSETEILELYSKSYLYKLAINTGVPLFRKITGKDPLGFILKKINLARVKDNVFYIDIGRWLRGNEKIMTTLYKAQVNYGAVAPEQLILKANINPRDLLASNTAGNLITEEDNPNPISQENEDLDDKDLKKIKN